jgi:hypothetical protein
MDHPNKTDLPGARLPHRCVHVDPRSVPLPPLDSPDTLSALIAALPESLSASFPESLSFLASLARVQQSILEQARNARTRQQLVQRALTAMDPTRPSSIVGLGRLLASVFPERSIGSVSRSSLELVSQRVEDYLAGHFPNVQLQGPPVIPGLQDLTQVFVDKGVVAILEARDRLNAPGMSPSDFSFQCIMLAQVIAAYASVVTWKAAPGAAHLSKIFGTHGVSNLAANVLSSLIHDPASDYAARHLEQLAQMAQQVREEDLRRNLALAMAHATPERAQEALNLLRGASRRPSLG